jgi:hypothetical protein
LVDYEKYEAYEVFGASRDKKGTIGSNRLLEVFDRVKK